MKGIWEVRAMNNIRQVVENNPGLNGKELRRAISKAYPFGERKDHPYRIWLRTVKRYMAERTTIREMW